MYPYVKVMREYLDKSGITSNDIDKVVSTTQGIFGHDWLEDLIKVRQETPPFAQHPIMNGCASGSFTHLMDLIELDTCIVSFKDDKELSKIIPPLKMVSSYNDNFFQLVIAYRFKKLGFITKLEPKIENGLLADFEAVKDDEKIIAECTLLRGWGVREEEQKVFWECVFNLRRLYKKGADRIVIDIVSTNALTFETLKTMRTDIIKVVDGFYKDKKNTKLSNEFYEINIYEVDAETNLKLRTDGETYFKSLKLDYVLSFSLVPPKITGDITSAVGVAGPTSILKYKNLTPLIDPLEDRIDKKVRDKFKQLKSHPKGYVSVLFIEVEDKLENADIRRIGNRLLNVFKEIPSLNAVILTKRNWTTALKHQYQGTVFSNPNNPLSDKLFQDFTLLERDINFINEWKSLF
jgi:hypothetical protein